MAVQGRSYTFAISFRNGRGWRVCGLPPFDRNLAHWSQLGPAGTFSTSLESWGSTQCGRGMFCVNACLPEVVQLPKPDRSDDLTSFEL